MSSSPSTGPAGSSRPLGLFAALVVSALAAAALWVWFDRPVTVAESWNEPLASVSFAPFRRGQSPLTKVYPTPEQVAEDLDVVASRARGVRTYTSLEGMQVVPDLAAKLGLKVVYGAWLGSDVEKKGRDQNEAEIGALIKAANAHPEEINRVIVGNEVLLRNDLKPDQLIGFIRRVKAEIKQPVSYADVWAFYLKYPEVGREVDYITIHILPFWEDEPVDIDHVEDHVVEIVERIRAAFPGKPILIGETGWPSLGRDRGPAHVSTVNAARYVRKIAAVAARHGFDYNIVEAFDQPWKAKLENTVGAAWGIFDVDRQAKFDMAGPVIEVANWKIRAAWAIAGGALAGLLAGAGLKGFLPRLAVALAAQILAWLAVTASFHALAVSFRWWQDLWAPLRGGLAVAFAWYALKRLSVLLAAPGDAVLPGPGRGSSWAGEALALFSGVYGLVWTLLLVFDGRYRDIPVIDFGAPVIATLMVLAARAIGSWRSGAGWAEALSFDGLFSDGAAAVAGPLREGLTGLLARALPLAAAAAIVSEGIAIVGDDFTRFHPSLAEQVPLIFKAMVSNQEINLWAAMLVVLAIPYMARRASRKRRPASLEQKQAAGPDGL